MDQTEWFRCPGAARVPCLPISPCLSPQATGSHSSFHRLRRLAFSGMACSWNHAAHFLPNTVPRCGWTAVGSLSRPKDICWGTCACWFSRRHAFATPLGEQHGARVPSPMQDVPFREKPPHRLPALPCRSACPPAASEASWVSASSPAFGVVSVPDCRHADRCRVYLIVLI